MQLHMWMNQSNKVQRGIVARLCQTSVNNLYQVAGGHTGISTGLALKLEKTILEITPERPVWRWEMLPDIWQSPGEYSKTIENMKAKSGVEP